MLSERLLSILVCPEDRGPLLLIDDERSREERGSAAALYNPRLRLRYRIDDGIPVLLVDEAEKITDDVEHDRLVAAAAS